MNIQIYRGVDTRTGDWAYGNHLALEGYHFIVPTTNILSLSDVENPKEALQDAMYITVHPNSVGRRVGFKDKKSIIMFEGDIIKMPVTGNKDYHGKFTFKEIIYRNGQWMLSYLKSEKGFKFPTGYTVGSLVDEILDYSKDAYFSDDYFDELPLSNFEVVGSRFFNPEYINNEETTRT